jgi:hypothetical protein
MEDYGDEDDDLDIDGFPVPSDDEDDEPTTSTGLTGEPEEDEVIKGLKSFKENPTEICCPYILRSGIMKDAKYVKYHNPPDENVAEWFAKLEDLRRRKINPRILRSGNDILPKPLYLDFDFGIFKNNSPELKDEDIFMVQQCVVETLTKTVICNSLEVPSWQKLVNCLVMQRPDVNEKFGIHMHFPYVFLINGSDFAKELKKTMETKTFSLPFADAFDNCMNKSWYFYGSGKSDGKSTRPPYQICRASFYESKKVEIIKDEADKESNEALCRIFNTHVFKRWLIEEEFTLTPQNIQNHLIELLDTCHLGKTHLPCFPVTPTTVERNLNSISTAAPASKRSLSAAQLTTDTIEKQLKHLAIENGTAYNYWIAIAYSLKTHFQDDEDEGFRLFDLFTRLSHKHNHLGSAYSHESTRRTWDYLPFQKNRYNLVDLLRKDYHWTQSFKKVMSDYVLNGRFRRCRCDNATCERENVDDFMVTIFPEKIGDVQLKRYVIQIVKSLFKTIASSSGVVNYYRFNGHSTWTQMNDMLAMGDISTIFCKSIGLVRVNNEEVNQLQQLMNKRIQEIESVPRDEKKEPKKNLQKTDVMYSTLEKLHEKLSLDKSNWTFRSVLHDERCDIREVSPFKDNRNTARIPFSNGVYDCRTNEFRDSEGKEFFTVDTGYPFVPSSEEDTRAMLNFFKTMFPDDSLREYVFDILASSCMGHNNQKKVYFLIGDGNNGKSTMAGIVKEAFGSLLNSPARQALDEATTRNTNHDSYLFPMLQDHIRIVFSSEGSITKLSSNLLKIFSGQDSVEIRQIFSSTISVTCGAVIFIARNDVPRFDEIDNALFRRIVLVPCLVRFYGENEKMPMQDQRHVRLTPFLADDLRRMGRCLMEFLCKRLHVLFNSRSHQKGSFELAIPQIVKEFTLFGSKDMHPVLLFLSKILQRIDGNDAENPPIDITILHAEYDAQKASKNKQAMPISQLNFRTTVGACYSIVNDKIINVKRMHPVLLFLSKILQRIDGNDAENPPIDIAILHAEYDAQEASNDKQAMPISQLDFRTAVGAFYSIVNDKIINVKRIISHPVEPRSVEYDGALEM